MTSSPTRLLRSSTSKIDSRVELFEPFDYDEPETKRRKLESPSADESDPVEISPKSSPKKSPAKTKYLLPLTKAHPTPKRWEETLDIIMEQRKGIIAPVDSMGCDDAGKQEDESARLDNDDRSKRLRTLVSLMLSSQTKDPVTAQATSNLRNALPGGLTLDSLLAASEDDISTCINKVGFWRRKTQYIKATAVILKETGGDVPKTIEELLALPGVGPKMGMLALQSCWDINFGIGVDVHVHRITNRLRWHNKPTSEAEQTRVNLESWLPKELHKSINHTLVGFGQVICLPVGPRCDLCNVAKVPGLCPSKQKVSPRKITKKEAADLEGQAKVKVEIEHAVVENSLITGSLLESGDQVDELRTVKTEGDQVTFDVHHDL